MDRDKVLPLVRDRVPFEPPYLTTGPYRRGTEAQQEADWERVKPLVEAAQIMRDYLFEIERDPMGRIRDYTGISTSRDRLADALARLDYKVEVKE